MPIYKPDFSKVGKFDDVNEFLARLQRDLDYFMNNLDNDNVSYTLSTADVKDYMIDWGTGANQVSGIDIPIADASSYYTNDTVEQALAEIGGNFSSHISTTNIHYLTTNISHTVLQDIGSNSHAQIDLHIASTTNPHGSAYLVGNELSTVLTAADVTASSDIAVQLNLTNSLINQIRHALIQNGLATS